MYNYYVTMAPVHRHCVCIASLPWLFIDGVSDNSISESSCGLVSASDVGAVVAHHCFLQ